MEFVKIAVDFTPVSERRARMDWRILGWLPQVRMTRARWQLEPPVNERMTDFIAFLNLATLQLF